VLPQPGQCALRLGEVGVCCPSQASVRCAGGGELTRQPSKDAYCLGLQHSRAGAGFESGDMASACEGKCAEDDAVQRGAVAGNSDWGCALGGGPRASIGAVRVRNRLGRGRELLRAWEGVPARSSCLIVGCLVP